MNKEEKVLVVSEDGRDGSIAIKQDAELWVSRRPAGSTLEFPIRQDRGVWVQVVKGELKAGEHTLQPGDALIVQEESMLQLRSLTESETLIFDLN